MEACWFELGPGHGVLELPELRGVGLELHLVGLAGPRVAYWLDHEGRWLGRVPVGRC